MKTVTDIIRLMAISWGMAMLLGSCASEQTVTKTQVKKDIWGNAERYSVGKDKDGNPVMKSDRRSSLEGKRSQMAGRRDFRGEDYTKDSYRKKRWVGKSLFGRKKYQGNTDANQYRNEPWFVRNQVKVQNQRSSAEGKTYGVNPFRKSTAREQSGDRMTKPEDAETGFRRRVFKQPEITHWKDQSALSVGDTNKMLGR
ncbi:MAG: hypothetical protein KJO21_04420 [Verrucomicrobiae bacterium]|nr:hypothetical protein [Verrucomicrobiae bacterium]NNJ42968.1 hypothetical protein [Akkermansiaceae bacterium]